jgi:hypothetical protein
VLYSRDSQKGLDFRESSVTVSSRENTLALYNVGSAPSCFFLVWESIVEGGNIQGSPIPTAAKYPFYHGIDAKLQLINEITSILVNK